MRTRKTILRLIAAVGGWSLATSGATGATLYWDANGATSGAGGAGGTAPGGTWGTDAFWSADSNGEAASGAWTSANDAAVFSAGTSATGTYTVDISGTLNLTAGIRIEEGTVTLGSASSTISYVTGQPYIEVAPALAATLRASVSGGAIWRKQGDGTLLIRSNSSSGQLDIAGGVVSVDTASRLPTNGITIRNGATLRSTNAVGGQSFANSAMQIGASGGTIDTSVAVQSLYTSTITGSGNTLTKTGPGEFRIQGSPTASNTFGKLNVTQGSWILGSVPGQFGIEQTSERSFGGDPANFTSDAITISNGATIGARFQISLHANRGITLGSGGGIIDTTNSPLFDIPGIISGSGSLTKTGSGSTVMWLRAANTYTGGTNILNGRIEVVGSGKIGPGPLSISSFATLKLETGNNVIGSLSGAANSQLNNQGGQLTINQSADTTFAGEIVGNQPILKQGAGTLTLTAFNAQLGTVTIKEGIVSVGADNNIGFITHPVTLDGGTLRTTGNVTSTNRGIVVNSGGGTFDTGTFNTSLTNVSGTGDLTKASSGNLTVDRVRISDLAITGGHVITRAVGGTSTLDSLSVTGASHLDLSDNALVVKNMPIGAWDSGAGQYTGVLGLVDVGRGAASWNGAGIITSQSLAASGSQLTTLAVVHASQANLTDSTQFRGVAIDASNVLVAYSYAGDADLTGAIDGDDYLRIDSHVDEIGVGYSNGDFNYDGTVNGDDYFLIDRNFGAQQAPFANSPALQIAAVPEPSAIALAGASAALLLRRRRQRKTTRL